eukprot:scaffold682_cov363-Pavlova_lutheri.AAC.54
MDAQECVGRDDSPSATIHAAGSARQSGGEHKAVVGDVMKDKWCSKRSPEWAMESYKSPAMIVKPNAEPTGKEKQCKGWNGGCCGSTRLRGRAWPRWKSGGIQYKSRRWNSAKRIALLSNT